MKKIPLIKKNLGEQMRLLGGLLALMVLCSNTVFARNTAIYTSASTEMRPALDGIKTIAFTVSGRVVGSI
jgi:hypothetical protein